MSNSLDTLLRHVARPARYAGAEWNSQKKHWDSTRIRIALAHPDLYESGVSNPRLISLYALLAERKDILAERVYAPAQDMVQALKTAGLSLFAVESRRPLTDFDVILFDLGRELAWTSILGMLDAARVPLAQGDRDSHPVVIGWAGETTNPEPLADVLDAVLLGDAEAILPDLLAALDASRGGPRASLLRALARVEGVYVPSLHAADTGPPSFSPPAPIRPRYMPSLPLAPSRPPVPWLEALRDRGVVELQRGGAAGSLAHLAGLTAPPVRTRGLRDTVEALTALMHGTGYEEIDLSGPCFDPARFGDGSAAADLRSLVSWCRDMHTGVHLPPLAPESVTPDLVRALAGAFRSALTLAPELLSSVRLSSLLDGPKGAALREALAEGQEEIGTLRLSFVVGHPLEDEEGWKLAGPYVQMLRRSAGKKTRIRLSTVTFLPRPRTPHVRAPLPDPDLLRLRLQALRKAVSRAGGTLILTDPEMGLVEGIITRGDRRMGTVLRDAWEAGSYLETWRESFSLDRWSAAFAKAGLDMNALREAIPKDAPLPWDHICLSYSPT